MHVLVLLLLVRHVQDDQKSLPLRGSDVPICLSFSGEHHVGMRRKENCSDCAAEGRNSACVSSDLNASVLYLLLGLKPGTLSFQAFLSWVLLVILGLWAKNPGWSPRITTSLPVVHVPGKHSPNKGGPSPHMRQAEAFAATGSRQPEPEMWGGGILSHCYHPTVMGSPCCPLVKTTPLWPFPFSQFSPHSSLPSPPELISVLTLNLGV